MDLKFELEVGWLELV